MIDQLIDRVSQIIPTGMEGRVVETSGFTIHVGGLPAPIGATVAIERHAANEVEGEVVGFRDGYTVVCPLGETAGIRQGSRVRIKSSQRTVPVGNSLLGRVLDARARPIDHQPVPQTETRLPIHSSAPSAIDRPPIDTSISTGIRAIDGLLTLGKGQRVGIFAGSGVGKSVTLGMIARYTSADVNVIALIGERGREVNEFLTRDLGEEGLARSVVVVATSDEPAIARVQAAFAATSVAEFFRAQGQDVLLMMDSVTRFAMAQREIGLAAGEPPTTRGYPPSVFSLLPRLVERAGRTEQGSITGVYSVLVEGDDTNEPISDAVRGLLDGHIVLSRKLASRGHYPAIDVLESISRLMPTVADEEHLDAARTVRQMLATYAENEDLITIGAYRSGANVQVDTAISLREATNAFLQQKVQDHTTLSESARLIKMVGAEASKRQAGSSDPPANNQSPDTNET